MKSTFYNFPIPACFLGFIALFGANHLVKEDGVVLADNNRPRPYSAPLLASGFSDWQECDTSQSNPPGIQTAGFGLASLCGGVQGCSIICGGGGTYNASETLAANAIAWAPPHDFVSSRGDFPVTGADHENVFADSGEVILCETDFVLPGVGFDFSWYRTYRSGSDSDGDLGYGWDFSANIRLTEDPLTGAATVFLGDGRSGAVYANSSGEYVSPAGASDTLTKGTRPGVYSPGPYAGRDYFTKTEKSGVVREFDLIDSVAKVYGATVIRDLLGNEIKLTYASLDNNPYLASLSDTHGKIVSLTYLGVGGRLSKVVVAGTAFADYTDLTIDYEYNANGTLKTVTHHQERNELGGSIVRPFTQYTYYSGGIEDKNIQKVFRSQDSQAPGATAQLTFEYDPGNLLKEWCTKVTDGDGDEYSYEYEVSDSSFDFTQYTDPLGSIRDFVYTDLSVGDKTIERVREHLLDNSGNLYTAETVITRDCSCGRITKLVYPDASEQRWEFDGLGNISRYIRVSQDSTDPWLTQEWTYADAVNHSRLTSSSGALQEVVPGTPAGLASEIDWTWRANGTLDKVEWPTVSSGQPSSQNIEWFYEFDGNGRILSKKTPVGLLNSWTYSGNVITALVGPVGSEMVKSTEERNAFGSLVKGTGKYGPTSDWNFVVSPSRLLSISGPSGELIEYKYSLPGLRIEERTLHSSTPALWETTVFAYTDGGLLKEKIQDSAASGIQALTSYVDSPGNRYTETISPDGVGERVEFGFGSHNLVYKKYNIDTTSSPREVLIETLQRNSMGQITSSVGMDGVETEFAYDGYGRLESTEVELPSGKKRVTTNSYLPWGAIEKSKVSVTGTCLKETFRFFDEAWRSWKTEDRNQLSGAARTSYVVWDAGGVPISETNSAGGASTTLYDSYGRLDKVVDYSGSEFVSDYDVANRKVTNTRREKNTITGAFVEYVDVYEQDLSGNLVQIESKGSASGSRIVTFGYDLTGNQITAKSPLGNELFFEYDRLGRLKMESRNISGPTSQILAKRNYSPGGRLEGTEDGDGNTTSFTYNRFGKVLTKTITDGLTLNLSQNIYSPVTGLLTEQQRPSGIVYELFYDSLSRVDYVNLNKGATGLSGPDRLDYSYTPLGGIAVAKTQVSLGGGYSDVSVVTRSYDGYGQINSETQSSGGLSAQFDYEYGDLGGLTRVVFPDQANSPVKEIIYDHDSAGRIRTVKRLLNATVNGAATGIEVTATLDYQGRKEVSRSQPTFDLDKSIEYTPFAEISKVAYQKSSNTSARSSFEYAWDNDSRLVVKNRLHDASGGYEYGEVYRYDDTSRLVKAWRNVKSPMNYITTDPIQGLNQYLDLTTYNVGLNYERESVVTAPYTGSATTQAYVTNGFHQIENDGANTITWNSDGQNTGFGSTGYAWDSMGLLESGTLAGNTVSFQYDAFGRRISQGNGSAESKFVFLGDQVIGEYDSVAGSWIWQQIPVGKGEGILEHLAVDTADYDNDGLIGEYQMYAVLDDYQESFCCLVDKNTSPVEIYDATDSFGGSRTRNSTGSPIGAFASEMHCYKRMQGGLVIPNLGIYDFRNRWFSPSLGSWLSRDPLGNIDSENLYQGMLASPTVFSDPSGLSVGGQTTATQPKGPKKDTPTKAKPAWEQDFGLSTETVLCVAQVKCRPIGPLQGEAIQRELTKLGVQDTAVHCFIQICIIKFRVTTGCGFALPSIVIDCTTYSLMARDYMEMGTVYRVDWGPFKFGGEPALLPTGESYSEMGANHPEDAEYSGSISSSSVVSNCEGLAAYLKSTYAKMETYETYDFTGPNSNSWVRETLDLGGSDFVPPKGDGALGISKSLAWGAIIPDGVIPGTGD